MNHHTRKLSSPKFIAVVNNAEFTENVTTVGDVLTFLLHNLDGRAFGDRLLSRDADVRVDP